MGGGKGNIKPKDGKQFSQEYQPEEKWTEKKAIELGEDMISWLKESDTNLFFGEYLHIVNNYYPSLISYLRNKFTSFSKLIEKAKKIQELKLYKFGVADRLNASMTKFVLINEHQKVSDNSKQDITSGGEKINQDTTVTFVNARKKECNICIFSRLKQGKDGFLCIKNKGEPKEVRFDYYCIYYSKKPSGLTNYK